jgi:hypothetical protein
MAFGIVNVHRVIGVSAIANTYSPSDRAAFGAVDLVFQQEGGQKAALEIYTVDPAIARRIADALNAAFPPAKQDAA